MPIASDIQQPSAGEMVILFDLDFTRLGGAIYYLTQASYASSDVVWKGNTYTKIGIQAEGFESTSKGTIPRPRVRVDNMKSDLLSVVKTLNDGIGGRVTRWRTYRKYLDDQSHADPDMHFPKDLWVIEQKVLQNALMIEWELSSPIDFEGRKVPGRQILRDFCSHTYRRWSGSAWIDNSSNPELISCPYDGTDYFDADGTAVLTQAADVCGKKLTDCIKRFGDNAVLPTRAFPNVARNRLPR